MKKIIFIVLFAASFPAFAEVVKVRVDGLVCAFCASSIEKKLRANAATDDVYVSLEHKLVALALKEGQDIPDATLRAQITDAGYEVKSVERTKESLAQVRASWKAKAN